MTISRQTVAGLALLTWATCAGFADAPATPNAPTTPLTRDVVACAAAPDQSRCVIDVMQQIPLQRSMLAAWRVPGVTRDAASDAAGWLRNALDDVIAADHAGVAPPTALAAVDKLPAGRDGTLYVVLCATAAQPYYGQWGPRYAAWLQTQRASAALLSETANRLEAKLPPAAAPDAFPTTLAVVGLVAGCRDFAGDVAGADRALARLDAKSVPVPAIRLRLLLPRAGWTRRLGKSKPPSLPTTP
ncbi:MAG TPA: hypothetical protein VGL66_19255 [Caulobacteraceae bacterium]|jgi:hypothetical protein